MTNPSTGFKKAPQGEHTNLAGIPVSSIMTPSPTTVRSNAEVKAAIRILVNRKITGVPVVNEKNQLVGVVSENDLLLLAASGSMSRPLQYTKNPDFVRAKTTLKEALIKMIQLKRKWFPVLDDTNKIIGIIARCDLLKVLLEKDTE
ncbi:MAG: CBS domain-containing protein [Pseudomonadota bacterium]